MAGTTIGMPRTPSGTPIMATPAITVPAPSATSRVGTSSSATIRATWPAVPPSSRIVANSARRSDVAIAAVLISASAANSTDRPTTSHTPHASSLFAACSVARYCERVSVVTAGCARA